MTRIYRKPPVDAFAGYFPTEDQGKEMESAYRDLDACVAAFNSAHGCSIVGLNFTLQYPTGDRAVKRLSLKGQIEVRERIEVIGRN